MDRLFGGFDHFLDGYTPHDDYAAFPIFPEDELVSRLNITGAFDDCRQSYTPPDPNPMCSVSQSVTALWSEPVEDYDFTDAALKYINQILMEEDIGEKSITTFQDASALQAAEKSFYDVIGEKYVLSADPRQLPYVNGGNESTSSGCVVWGKHGSVCAGDSIRTEQYEGEDIVPAVVSSESVASSIDRLYDDKGISTQDLIDSSIDTLVSSSPKTIGSKFVRQSTIGYEGINEGELLAFGSDLGDVESSNLSAKEMNAEAAILVCDLAKEENVCSVHESGGKKKALHENETPEEGRVTKQSLTYAESNVRSEIFDMVLLSHGEQEDALREALRNLMQNKQSKGPNEGKTRRKKQGRRRKDVVDLRTLLTLCAQAVVVDDRGSAHKLLKQIRQHASPTGDGMQRMAHYFADGLEARLAGSTSQIYRDLIARPVSVAEVLKAYHLFLAACPFKKLSNFFSNKTILNAAETKTKLHIVDFGIVYGFQWPGLIQRLSWRPNGPPEIRITGIELPEPGFRPDQRIEETGRRLMSYATTFNVPFEYNAIAKNWDAIELEDLKIRTGELLIANCIYRLQNTLDETLQAENPRDAVLNLIRRMNPDIFIQGNINGGHGVPFFATRFREALFHFSAIFDMLDMTVPRDVPERLLLEREIFGKKAMNVIACEGSERIERPETYKMWHMRTVRAGFRPLPLNQDMVTFAKDRLRSHYHKDFVIEEDREWLLQSWKGRIVFALSTWRPDGCPK